MEALTEEADRLWEEHREGRPLGENQGIQEFVEKGPVMTQMVADDRIWGTVEGLLGPGFVWNGSEGNLSFSSEHGWHTDRANEPHATSYSFHLYLDPMKADTGSLRIIPGSHRPPFHDSLYPNGQPKAGQNAMADFGVSGAEIPGLAVESEPGDVVFFSQKIYHGVFSKQPGRRYLKLRFVAWPETDEAIASLMRYGNRGAIYRPNDAFLNSEVPRIRAMVDPLLELAARTEAQREHFDTLGAREDRYLSQERTEMPA
jgi:hypothetical protein